MLNEAKLLHFTAKKKLVKFLRSIEKGSLTKRSLTNSFHFRNVSVIKVIKGLRISLRSKFFTLK